MADENPIMRQISNVLTTLGFFALIAYLAHSHSIGEQTIFWILGTFTVGTTGVKVTRHVSTSLSQRMRAVRRTDYLPPNDDGGAGGGGGGNGPHTAVTRPALERQGGPGPYERERGKGPGGIIRRIIAWGPTVLVLMLSLLLFGLASVPIAFATPQDPPVSAMP